MVEIFTKTDTMEDIKENYNQDVEYTAGSLGENDKLEKVDTLSEPEVNTEVITALVEEDHQHEIKLRTMSWQKAACLLIGDQFALAIMAQPWSLNVLGWVPGFITIAVMAALFWVTSITMHRFIMKHPEIMNICDFGYLIFGGSRIAYIFSAFMLVVNNVILIGFHVLTGTQIFNTLSNHSICSVGFSVISAVIGIIISVPRTLHHVSLISIFSSACMAVAILLFMVFVGIEDNPLKGPNGNFPSLGPVSTSAFPREGTTWVDGMNAVLNITFLWVPQILFPTFIAEMRRPQDFPKSLGVLMAFQVVLFTVPPIIGYYYLGQYAMAPAFGSLGNEQYKKAAFAFVIVPSLVIGAIYANVTAKFVYLPLMGKSRHAHSNTFIGWGVWLLVMALIWIVAFIFAEVVPSMGDFLSLLGAAFDSFFGFIFFSVAYWQLFRGHFFTSPWRSFMSLLHVFILIMGLFILGPGLYAAVESIIEDYSGGTRPAFSCGNLSL
ncbi:hypothetical protein MCUN1_002815 [Malassezia cuniculi]|uniref:Amino acid transporter transmembrane domain-containing protein n=1 Tax=Malassezia cuniculi TaxID=948313 RepID=A0AAF0EWQ3_9BASI|nr:hypothetical protein MCUN1_002815 [Malassezia cuniculi]